MFQNRPNPADWARFEGLGRLNKLGVTSQLAAEIVQTFTQGP
jgi:hypothetical protein